MKFTKKLTVITLAICALALTLGILPIHGESELYSNVLRLHVLANSDSEEDQALKLKVRDAILAESASMLADCDSRDEAISTVQANIQRLKSAARDVIVSEGYDYSVDIELGEEVYPTRDYESFCFPSGSYVSLRVMIGDAQGQNWWCVLFPPMCLGAATGYSEDAYISVGLTGDQYKLITETESPTYTARFKILEAMEEALR